MKFFERLRAKKLERIEKNSDIEGYLALLKSDDVDIQIRAVKVFGDMKDPRAVDPLIQVYLNDPNVSYYAQTALIKIGDIVPLMKLFSSITELDSAFRQRLAFMFGQIKDPRAIPLLIDMISEPGTENKEAAIEALGSIGDISTKDLLISLFRKSNPGLWKVIANSLKKNSWQPLDQQDLIRYHIGLGSWEQCEKLGSNSIDALLLYLDYYSCDNDAITTIGGVGKTYKDPRIGIKLSECLKNCEYTSSRRLALLALGLVVDPLTVDPIGQHLLSNCNDVEQSFAIGALGAIGNEKSIYYLKEALVKYKDPMIQKHILQMLGRIQNSGNIKFNMSEDLIIQKAQEKVTNSLIFDPNVRCSICNTGLEFLGGPQTWHGPGASVQGLSKASFFQLEQWRGNICIKCRLIFCPKCIEVGYPSPCPKCGTPTKPAQKGYVEQIKN